jgi:hypothetical protein
VNWAFWQAAERCSGRAAPGAVALLRWLEGRWPQGWSGGIYNCRPVRGRQSMSVHAEGRAVDFMLPGRSNPAGIDIVRALGADGDRNGIQTVIWDRRIWSRRSPNGRAYTGVNPHTDHLHIELNRSAASSLTVERLGGIPTGTPRPTVRRGDRGAHVANVQRLLGLATDGIFGPKTEQAVRAFQQQRRLKVDGVVGPQTWAALTS